MRGDIVDSQYLKFASYAFYAIAFTKLVNTPVRTLRK